MSESVVVVGAGAWGTAVAAMCSLNTPTVLCGRDGALIEQLRMNRINERYHPGLELPRSLAFDTDIRSCVETASIIFLAVPSASIQNVVTELGGAFNKSMAVVSLAKGFDPNSGQRISELIESLLLEPSVAVMTGPNIAGEVLAGHPSAAVVAAQDRAVAERVRNVVGTPTLHIFTNTDVVGVEVGGAVKNVIAIAAGVAEGLGFGHNTRAALITRGLAEMRRLAEALGADPWTLAGLAGLGDLVVTCTSPDSRNHRAGLLLADGATTAEIKQQLSHLPEGIRAAAVICDVGRRHNVDLPIAKAVTQLIEGGSDPRDIFRTLLERANSTE